MNLKLEWWIKLKQIYWQHRLYTSIEELPIKIWFKLNETMDLTLLYKKSYFKPNKARLEYYFAKIYNEFNMQIGFGKEFTDYLNTIKRKMELQLQCIKNPTPLSFANLSIIDAEIEDKRTEKGEKLEIIIASMSKYMGRYIDPKTISVLEFYSNIKIMKDGR